MTDLTGDAPDLEPLDPDHHRGPAGRLRRHGRSPSSSRSDRRRVATGAGRVERERVRRPPHRGRAARVRRPDPRDHRAAAARPDIPPDLEAWDPPAVAEARRDDLRSADELAGEFVALRQDGVDLVRGLRRADLARVGLHPDVGQLRVDELLGEWVHHDRNHIRQMLAVTQARVWGQMGNARRFSLEDL